MAKNPDRIVILAADQYLVDVKVDNLNVRVMRRNRSAVVQLTDLEDESRGSTIHMPYREPADFRIAGVDIGEWEKWMEETQNFKTLDTMLAWMRHYDDPSRQPRVMDSVDPSQMELLAPRKVTEEEGGPFPHPVDPGQPGDVKVEFPITADAFRRITGFAPDNDDLARCNCTKAGEAGHFSCGMCRHGLPVWNCTECFKNPDKLEGRQVNNKEETSNGTG